MRYQRLTDDVDAARTELIGRGVKVSEVFHFDAMLLRATEVKGRVPGPDPEGRPYFSFASFNDSRRERLAASAGHGAVSREPTAPTHHGFQWYAAYIAARVLGSTPEEAAKHGALHIERTRDRVPA